MFLCRSKGNEEENVKEHSCEASSTLIPLEHGGQLVKVAKSLGMSDVGWLDLSTGISPISYPVSEIPEFVWRELPQQKQSLLLAAKAYYGADEIMVTSGSQSVIQILPKLWDKQPADKTTVLLPAIGYKEHEKAWQDNGFLIKLYHELPTPNELRENSILVVINPNNPSGCLAEVRLLKTLHKQLQLLNGWLIVDEAFMDVFPKEHSIITQANAEGIFVLRSVGKFFGLAGIRAGFVSSQTQWLKKIETYIGPWQVSGPALYLTEKALLDIAWQQQQMDRLSMLAKRLNQLLVEIFCMGDTRFVGVSDKKITGTDLFITINHPQSEQIYQALCRKKVYVRLCDNKQALRFGIPRESDFERLEQVLLQVFKHG